IPLAGSAQAEARPVAAAGDPNQIGAPMPGMVVRVAVRAGQSVEKGEPLLALEAMKMETVIAAPRAATIQAVHVAAGDSVQARQLLVELGD
ncbi:MAG: biotin/lipoyl-binding protein, partial [Gammaproteobacteria bacterium]|nr:biotin/lipoyl-binding protein [Gammaproteobacteria bacterium]